MAFLKKARAAVVQPNWGAQNWQNFISSSKGRVRTASSSPDLVSQASDILQDNFSPENYLLTHATIVASVDTEEVPNIRLGTSKELGRRVNRRWANYRVKPGTDIYINNNHDCWDRPVLLNSYRTFVGAHNFLEHVQIEEQSKGRIIDAAARDIGDSIYIDILVATNRKHASLIQDIESGRMGAMSMGCSVTHTVCTKCGNVAVDETEMCDHIKYQKGNYEFDEQGRKYRVAELCGHTDLEPDAGVHFIEASWVAVPAFQGAVLRNVLSPDQVSQGTQSQMQEVLRTVPQKWAADDGMAKAANLEASFDKAAMMPPPPMPGMDPGMGDGGEEDPMKDLETEVEKLILDKVKKSIKDKLKGKDEDKPASDGQLATSSNDNIMHQANVKKAALVKGTETLLRIARSDVELLDGLARLASSHGLDVSKELYRTALRVGSTEDQSNLEGYLRRCAKVLNRKPNTGEAKTLVRLGRILSLRKKTRF
jgi:hypothetical protein